MHKFLCSFNGSEITPVEANKKMFFQKLLNSYNELGRKFYVTIEIIEKDVNASQISLYSAFVIKAAEHFGISFIEMEELLFKFFPLNEEAKPVRVSKWKTKDLDDFINKASSYLSEFGFIFN